MKDSTLIIILFGFLLFMTSGFMWIIYSEWKKEQHREWTDIVLLITMETLLFALCILSIIITMTETMNLFKLGE